MATKMHPRGEQSRIRRLSNAAGRLAKAATVLQQQIKDLDERSRVALYGELLDTVAPTSLAVRLANVEALGHAIESAAGKAVAWPRGGAPRKVGPAAVAAQAVMAWRHAYAREPSASSREFVKTLAMALQARGFDVPKDPRKLIREAIGIADLEPNREARAEQ